MLLEKRYPQSERAIQHARANAKVAVHFLAAAELLFLAETRELEDVCAFYEFTAPQSKTFETDFFHRAVQTLRLDLNSIGEIVILLRRANSACIIFLVSFAAFASLTCRSLHLTKTGTVHHGRKCAIIR